MNPYVIIQIWSTDPDAAAWAEYGKSFIELDPAQVETLRSAGEVIATQFVGIPLEVDEEYVRQYEAKVSTIPAPTEMELWQRILLGILGVALIILGCNPEAPNPALVYFGIEMIVIAVTEHGIIDNIVQAIADATGNEALAEFSIYSPVTWTTNQWATLLNMGWTIALTYAMNYGINNLVSYVAKGCSYAQWIRTLRGMRAWDNFCNKIRQGNDFEAMNNIELFDDLFKSNPKEFFPFLENTIEELRKLGVLKNWLSADLQWYAGNAILRRFEDVIRRFTFTASLTEKCIKSFGQGFLESLKTFSASGLTGYKALLLPFAPFSAVANFILKGTFSIFSYYIMPVIEISLWNLVFRGGFLGLFNVIYYEIVNDEGENPYLQSTWDDLYS